MFEHSRHGHAIENGEDGVLAGGITEYNLFDPPVVDREDESRIRGSSMGGKGGGGFAAADKGKGHVYRLSENRYGCFLVPADYN